LPFCRGTDPLPFGFHLRCIDLMYIVGRKEIASVDQGPAFPQAAGKRFAAVDGAYVHVTTVFSLATFLRS